MVRQPSLESTPLSDFEAVDGVLPSNVAKRYWFFGDLARFGSIAASGQSRQTPIQCRKRPGRKQCQGLLSVRRRDLPAVIEWRCPECAAAGEISEWEGTEADLRGLAQSVSPDATAIPITVQAHRELRQLARDDERWLRVVYGIQVLEGSPALIVTCDQALQLGAMVITATFTESSARRRRLLNTIVDALVAPFANRSAHDEFVQVASKSADEIFEIVMSLGDIAPPKFVPMVAGPRPRNTKDAADRVAKTFQLKVTLRDVKPPVWRRLLVPADISLSSLHDILQAAMGWYDGHLHLFRAGDHEYAPPGDWDPIGEDSTGVVLCDLAPRKGSRLIYEYDFGDGWQHDIILEAVLDQKCAEVRCLTGRRSCPPEDCGGPWGYEELRAALTDPGHERHDEFSEWAPEEFDAEEFDVVLTDDLVRRIGI